MPAQRSYRPDGVEDELLIRVEGDLEPRNSRRGYKSIYFTDQSPCFTIVVEDTGEKTIEGKTLVRLSFEKSENLYEPWGTETIDFKLEPGGVDRFDQDIDLLPYQGSATISVHQISFRENNGRMKSSRHHKSTYQLYAFVVYDRDYYKVNYLTPRYAQYVSVFLAVLIVALGVIQLVL